MKTIIEPFKIKMVEPIRFTTFDERESILKQAHFNLFQIAAKNVIIDLLTDSGTSAMSSEQWSNILRADESYAGASSWYRLQNVLQEMTGMPIVLPTHQGRASERILFTIVGGVGKIIPSNNHFDTTRANIEYTGAQAVDLVIDEAYEPDKRHPFKGNFDTAKLLRLIEKVGAKNIPVCMVTITNNGIGGQPVSLSNLKETNKICKQHNIPLFIDGARFAENAYFIKQREKRYTNLSIGEIVKQTFDLADGALISAKKDALVNTGGVLLFRDSNLAQKAKDLLILTEGFTTYGGLAGRDLEAMADGFAEGIDERYLQYRIRSIEYLAEHLIEAGIPILQPPGGHAIYLDAKAFCPHIPTSLFPGQAIVCALYRLAGIRATELGSVMFGKKVTDTNEGFGENRIMELVRLAIPRRVYTQSHFDYVIEAIVEVYKERDKLKGLKIIEEPAMLRHFSAKFAEVS